VSIQPVSLPRGQQSYDQLVAAVETLLNQLARHPLANLKVLPAQTINPGGTRVYHGLGQRVTGYFLVGASFPGAAIADTGLETADPQNYINLSSTGGVGGYVVAVF